MQINQFFNDLPIRVIGTNEDPFFYASDIGDVLGIVNIHTSIRNFDDEDIVTPAVRAQHDLVTYQKQGDKMRRNPNVVLLTEIGTYRLIMRSNSPIAQEFQRFVLKLIRDRRRAEIVQINIRHATELAEERERTQLLDAKLAEISKFTPVIYVFEREISGNPYKFIPAKDVDHDMKPHQPDSDMLYKCTAHPTAHDYTEWKLIMKVFGSLSTVWGSIDGELLYTATGESMDHTKYFVDDEPQFNEGDIVRCDIEI